MDPAPVLVVNDDPTFQTQVEDCLSTSGYRPLPQPWAALAPATLAHALPAAIVVHLPSAGPPEQEHALLARLQADPHLRPIPVLLCSARPALLQSAVHTLQPRPGVVLASTPGADELVAKLAVAAAGHP